MKRKTSLSKKFIVMCCAIMLLFGTMFTISQNMQTVFAFTTGKYVVYAIDNAESQAGCVYMNGWAYRKDTNSECLRFDYYVYDNNNVFVTAGQISKSSRPDVKATFSNVISTNVGFEGKIWLASGTYKVILYAVIVDNERSEAMINKTFTVSDIPVTFDKQGGTGGTDSISVCYARPLTSITVPTKVGYTFGGYYTEENGTGNKLYNEDASSNVETFTIKSSNVTLYALWIKETYDIIYEIDDGINSYDNPETYNIETSTITLSDPTKDGFTFKGWYSESTFENQVTEITQGSTGAKTLYAKWEAEQQTPSTGIYFDNSVWMITASVVLVAGIVGIAVALKRKSL